jgi:hypothetical protein
MAEPILESRGCRALVREGIAATMSEHMRMRLDTQAGRRIGRLGYVPGGRWP